MSGLVWSALGQGISSLGNTMGSIMAREADREDRQEEQRRRDAERIAATERENQRNRELRMEMAAGRGVASTGGLTGDALDEAVAGEARMSLPDYRATRERFRTGDMSALKRDVSKSVDVRNPDNPDYESFVEQRTVSEVPKELEQEERSKWQVLERLRVKYSMGEKYKGMTEGEQNDFETGVGKGIITGTIDRDQGAGAVGAMKGMPGYKEGGGAVIDQYKGGPGVATPVGESQIAENRAQAAKYGAEAKVAGEKGKDDSLQTLQQMRKAAEGTLADARKALTEFDKTVKDLPKAEREKRADERAALAKEIDTARGNLNNIADRLTARLEGKKEAAATAGGGLPEPKTKNEFDRLPKGARYKAPDGTIRIK